MSVLLVVAHPDDEVLGAGGTAAALTSTGHEVRACILSGDVDARRHRPERSKLRGDILNAGRLLGLSEPLLGPFPNIAFNTVSHLEIVQFIEGAILDHGVTKIITHHPGDLNDDHHHTSRACQAAARLFQRRQDVPPLEALYYMEVLSSTDWSFASASEVFRPDTFFALGPDHIDRKLQSLMAYEGVMRPFPHPRSVEGVRSLAALRGGQSGVRFAEAFQTAFRASDPDSF